MKYLVLIFLFGGIQMAFAPPPHPINDFQIVNPIALNVAHINPPPMPPKPEKVKVQMPRKGGKNEDSTKEEKKSQDFEENERTIPHEEEEKSEQQSSNKQKNGRRMLGEDDDDWYTLNGVRINGKSDSYTLKNKNRCKPCEKKIPLIPLVMTTLLLFTAPSNIPRYELKDTVRCRYTPENNNEAYLPSFNIRYIYDLCKLQPQTSNGANQFACQYDKNVTIPADEIVNANTTTYKLQCAIKKNDSSYFYNEDDQIVVSRAKVHCQNEAEGEVCRLEFRNATI